MHAGIAALNRKMALGNEWINELIYYLKEKQLITTWVLFSDLIGYFPTDQTGLKQTQVSKIRRQTVKINTQTVCKHPSRFTHQLPGLPLTYCTCCSHLQSVFLCNEYYYYYKCA